MQRVGMTIRQDARTGSADDAASWPALMQAAQDGDQAAYLTLLRAITPWVRRIAARGLSNPHAAEDVVQDTLLSLHAARHTYDPARPFKPWLLAIARARLIDHLRRSIRAAGRETALQDRHETIADPAANQVQEGWDPGAWGSRALRAAIGTLPAGQREAVILLKLKEMSLQDASRTTGQSVNALKVAVHRAILRLRIKLQDPA